MLEVVKLRILIVSKMLNMKVMLVLCLLFCQIVLLLIDVSKRETVTTKTIFCDTIPDYCLEFNTLNNKIRDSLIYKEDAYSEFQILIPKLKQYYYKSGGKDYEEATWCFPVQGYNSKFIGGKNGSGYLPLKFDYLDGNNHSGHPAHDIFIYDSNQDCVDDRTKKEVNVLSMSGGIVIACDSVWKSTSDLRGGNYIWIYDPASNSIFYYAHNNRIFVAPCSFVEPGERIATVGRTGLNAYKKRSPTHLHFMQLKLDDKLYPRPVNCYKKLLAAKTIR